MTVEVEFEEPTRLPVHSGWYARVFSGRRCLFSTPGCVIRQHRSGPPRRIARIDVPLRLTTALPTLELRGSSTAWHAVSRHHGRRGCCRRPFHGSRAPIWAHIAWRFPTTPAPSPHPRGANGHSFFARKRTAPPAVRTPMRPRVYYAYRRSEWGGRRTDFGGD